MLINTQVILLAHIVIYLQYGKRHILKLLDMENRGGKRKGAGRKPAPYKTITIAFRVRTEWANEIKATVKQKLSELRKNSS